MGTGDYILAELVSVVRYLGRWVVANYFVIFLSKGSAPYLLKFESNT